MNDRFRVIKYFLFVVMVIQLSMVIFLLYEIRERQINTTGDVSFIKNYCLE